MKIFIDSANLKEIQEVNEWGLLDGVTTNPTLIAKELGSVSYSSFMDHIKTICSIVDGPVSVEVTSLSASEMIVEGEELARISSNVVVKCPLTEEGIKALSFFYHKGIKTNATLIFSATQALLAAKAGASMVSPFMGRLDDVSTMSVQTVEHIVQIFSNYQFETKVLAASIRSPIHVVEVALLGADIATMPFPVLKQLFNHPLTDLGLQRFMEDARVIVKNGSKQKRDNHF